jgi:hypothetical protein
VSEKIKEAKFQNRVRRAFGIQSGQISTLAWIETLLQTPIDDYRKNAIGLILAPYLVNIKKLSYGDAFQLLKNWLSKCNELRYLDTNFDYKIKYSLNTAIRKRQLPMKFDTLKTKNIELYTLVLDKMQSSKIITPDSTNKEFNAKRNTGNI